MRFGELPPPPKPLEILNEDVDRETIELLREAALAVSYLDWQQKVTLADFRKMKKLAIAQLWGRDDLPLSQALQMSEGEIEAYGKLDEFSQIKEALVNSFTALGNPQMMETRFKDPRTQDELYRKLRREIHYSRDDRGRTRLMEAAMDRAMPVISQKADQRVVIIREKDMDRLEATERELGAIGVSFEVLPEVALPNEPALLPAVTPPKADDSQ